MEDLLIMDTPLQSEYLSLSNKYLGKSHPLWVENIMKTMIDITARLQQIMHLLQYLKLIINQVITARTLIVPRMSLM